MTDKSPWWIDAMIFIIVSIFETFTFIRLKFKMDFSGKLTLILHFIVSLLRLISHLIPFEGALLIVWFFFFDICKDLVSFSLNYFIFEMKLINNTLTPDNM